MAQIVKEEPMDERNLENTKWEICESWTPARAVTPPGSEEKFPELKIPSVVSQKDSMTSRFVYDPAVTKSPRGKRSVTEEDKKDMNYWMKRLKNNDSARRSRLKKKLLEKGMEQQLKELQKENIELKYELAALKRYFINGFHAKSSEKSYHENVYDSKPYSEDTDSNSSDVSSTNDAAYASQGQKVEASPLSILTACAAAASGQMNQSQGFLVQQSMKFTPFPFKYSFIGCSDVKQELMDDYESEVDSKAKLPHKFRLKKDFHSAYHGQLEAEKA